MGYTGAVFERFFGTVRGTIIAAGALGLWRGLPDALGRHTLRARRL
jgi:hypothetical protein